MGEWPSGGESSDYTYGSNLHSASTALKGWLACSYRMALPDQLLFAKAQYFHTSAIVAGRRHDCQIPAISILWFGIHF